MKKYEAYKDSGVEWIEKIPQEWSTNRIKFLFSFGRGLSITKADLTETGVPVISYGQIHSKQNTGTSIDDHLLRYVPESIANEHEECQVKVGDFIFADTSEDKDGCGNCVYVDREGVFAGYHSLVVDGKGNDNKYFAYLFKSEDWRAQVRSKASGVKVFSITQSIMSDCSVLLPSKEEQQAIASYLDHKVGQIDASVSAINTQLDDLKAYRQSIISEAVTKGLNPNVPMKNSGIEWIGEIPDNWECVKVKHILHQSKDGIKIGPFGSSLTGKVDTKGDFKVYGQWNIVGKDFTAGRNYVGKDTYESLDSYVIVAGDILVSMMGTVGKCAIIPKGILPGIMDSHVVKVRLDTSKMIPSYFEYVYDKDNSNVIFSQIQKYRRGSIMDGLNSTLIKEFTLPSPPLSEQQAIASYLDSKTSKIDATIAFLESQRDDLNALKQSVISEAVTGKIDVREWNKNQ